MTKRKEFLIAIVVGVLVGGTILYLLVDNLCLKKAADIEDSIAVKQKEIAELEKSVAANGKSRKTIATYAAQTLGTDASKVGSQVQARLTAIIAKVGLTNTSGTGSPPLDYISPKALPSGQGVGQSLGWKISAKGRLDQVVDFLCYLDAEPYVHKIDRLRLAPNGPDVQVDLDFMTLVMVPVKDANSKTVTTMPATTQPSVDMAERRTSVQVIAARDVLRPYIQRIPPPPDPPPPPTPPTDTQPAPTPPVPPPTPPVEQNPDGRMRIADLTIYGGLEEVAVYDTATANRVERKKVGDKLAGGTIVMIDRRPLPRRDNPNLTSPGRVIVLIGEEYFAIEVGTVLTWKYPLSAELLPAALKKS